MALNLEVEKHGKDQRQVSFEEAYSLSLMHGAIYAEVSAMTNQNLQAVFTELIEYTQVTLL